jgi:hypothetical protein
MAASLLAALESVDHWAARLAAQADFPDERLNTRYGLILETLATKPLDSFPQAFAKPSQVQAVYRFLDNRRLDSDDFLQPLVDTTLDTCRGQRAILAIQDSSSANYASLLHTQGLGKLNDSDALGLHLHTTIAVGLDGIVRGLLHQSFWSRPPDAPPVAEDRKDKPIAAKESYKWLEGIEAAEAAIANLPEAERPRLIHVFDREGDIHEILERISASPHGAVIRVAQTERMLAEPHGPVDAAIHQAPRRGTQVVELPARHGVRARRATLELRSIEVVIQPNRQKHPHRQAVTWTLVEAQEVNAPAGVEPLRWLLWTTEPAATREQIAEVLRYYRLRWLIEDFHLTLKSGCQIENLRLETADRLCKAILMYSAIALRIVALRDLARQRPQDPCTTLLNDDQWRALYGYIHDRAATADTPIPTIKEAVQWIARLGGHLGRKNGQRQPGVRVLWRGWRDLTILVAGYQAGRQHR